MKIHELSCYEMQKLMQEKQISSEEIVTELLNYINTHDGKINSFLFVNTSEALAEAKKSDERRAQKKERGFLDGIPIAIKDNICTKGTPTTCASKILQNFIPPYDAHVIEKLKDAGAIIIGKTNLDEFAMGSSCENSSQFPTKNPWNQNCIPGGSSGGSAAAVAAGFAPIALGSDTGGSIRQPASMCGVVGLKPTYGRVSRFGLVAFGSSLDQIGPITKTVRDSAIVMETIAGKDLRDSTSSDVAIETYLDENFDLTGKKIGIPHEYLEQLDKDVAESVEKAIQEMKDKGAIIEDVSLPHSKYAIPVYYIISAAEASSNLARYDGIRYGKRPLDPPKNLEDLYTTTRSEGFGTEVKRRILLGTYVLSSGYYDAYYDKALRVRTLIKNDIEKALEKVDAIVTPTSPMTAFPLGEKVDDPLAMYLCDIFTVTINLAGNPAISIPCGSSQEGLPIGLQIITKPYEERKLLSMAHNLQKDKKSVVPELA